MSVANESGWVLLNRSAFEAVWDGEEGPEGVTVTFDETQTSRRGRVASHFGHGVLSFHIPYIFRTPPDYHLLVRGPANWPKDGICALEGWVESDWSFANFGMSWKFTRPNWPVRFEAEEPFSMVVPQRRGDLETFQPEIRAIASDAEMSEELATFGRQSEEVLIRRFVAKHVPQHARYANDWPRNYYKGLTPSGRAVPHHMVKRNLAGVARAENGSDPDPRV